MQNRFLALANQGIQQLKPYQPGKPIEEVERELGVTNVIKLASNENPLGISPLALDAMHASLKKLHLYPDGSGYELKQKLAKHLNISPEQITLGNGSDNIIDLLVKTFVHPGAEVISSEYAFANYVIATKVHNARPVIVAARNWGHNLEAMAKAITTQTQMIFIANPNNPTGTWVNEETLHSFLKKVPNRILVVLDEAYFEYITHPEYPNTIELQKKYPNLVITRTFSKVYGLAGVRVGYGISTPEIAELLNRTRLPFNVSSMGLVAAAAALDDTQHIQKSREINKKGMNQLENGISELGLTYIPSIGNFLTIDLGRPAQPLYEALLREGVIVRPLLPYSMPNHIRVTIGLPEENERFIKALKKVLL